MMKEYKIPAQPIPIGQILTEEFLNPLEISQEQLAKAMGVSRQTVIKLCDGRLGVNVEIALLLSKVFDTSSGFWLNLQMMNDLWQTQHNESFKNKFEHAEPLNSVYKYRNS